MLKQPISSYRGQVRRVFTSSVVILTYAKASELEIHRQEMRNTKAQMVEVLSKTIQKPAEDIARDINRPRYFDAWEAKDYGIIDQVLNG